MEMLKRHWLIAGLVVVAIAVFAAFQFKGADKSQYFTVKVDRGDIRQVVEATGTINAVTTVQVGSQVSGTISHLFADFNSKVKKGQLIAQIEPSLFEGTLLQAKADLANARANLLTAKANLEKAQATALQTKGDYDRTVNLTKGACSLLHKNRSKRKPAPLSSAERGAFESHPIRRGKRDHTS